MFDAELEISEVSKMDQDSTPEKTAATADLLFRYYQVLKQDQLLHVGGFKNRVRNSQIIGTALLGILAFLLNSPSYALSGENITLWIAVMAAVTTVTYYLVHDVLEAVFAVKALDEYLSFLEERVANLGVNGLFWQSGVAHNLWPTSPRRIGFPPPELCLGFYEVLLIAGATIGLPGFVYYRAWLMSDKNFQIEAILVGLSLYSVLSAVVTIWVSWSVNDSLRSKVRMIIDERWKIETTKATTI
jgi:hypothetical protein